MVVLPCSMGTLGKIAHSTCDNLLIRAADVFLKERRPLIVVPREMPMHLGHIENMAQIVRMGGILVPSSPFFYHHPQNIEELAGTVTGKILDLLQIEHGFYKPWRSE
jgi:4-hydroxy-3-polyprenylbenzoate decarboxylase